jgi:hypothetical protein
MSGQGKFRLSVKNPGEDPIEGWHPDVESARAAADAALHEDGVADLFDGLLDSPVWRRQGRTGEELQPGA